MRSWLVGTSDRTNRQLGIATHSKRRPFSLRLRAGAFEAAFGGFRVDAALLQQVLDSAISEQAAQETAPVAAGRCVWERVVSVAPGHRGTRLLAHERIAAQRRAVRAEA